MSRVMAVTWTDRIPAWLWLVLPIVALAPVWRWSAARLFDRSDDPLGIVALVALAVLVVRARRYFCEEPRLRWLIATMTLSTLAVVGASALPALARGVLAVLAVCSTLMALREREQPMLALTGLALLALPLLSSLQFFAGFPLRVITAEASRLLLGVLSDAAVERNGSALIVAGRLIMVDAPCSGIHMVWTGYFTAFASAAWLRLPDRLLLHRIPVVGLLVLGGNIVRNTLLVAKEAEFLAWPQWTHEAVGIAIFAAVCALILWRIVSAQHALPVVPRLEPLPDMNAAVFRRRRIRTIALALFAVLIAWSWLQPKTVAAEAGAPFVEWPHEYDGRPLRPLALSVVEQRFADSFPGAIARFTDGESAIVLRHVLVATRMLHPAPDCYRGSGYDVSADTLEYDAGEQATLAPKLWRCFVAKGDQQQLRVCEQIVDAAGMSFTDTSAWYWAAVTGRSIGPWRTITKATPIPGIPQ